MPLAQPTSINSTRLDLCNTARQHSPLTIYVVDSDEWRQIEKKQTRDVPCCYEDRVHAFSHPPCIHEASTRSVNHCV
ncbi:hypothetical protein Pmani_035507 [Petrolisthes manimaculis]|uniref:Uncharacterized protein n=1 Tax=Petrolisthes manimaculis TaxID=1843537 RepID=A0AAE1NM69_9EUCA|nr:hypothetical protein Pmani_035507 [Petrolisthes manimaculis]